jgi:hypothetical protein
MKKRALVPTEITEVVSITCDKCKKEVTDDPMEAQEFISINIDCGYMSILGDGNRYSVDLCQHCVKEVLGPYLRLTANYISGQVFDLNEEIARTSI